MILYSLLLFFILPFTVCGQNDLFKGNSLFDPVFTQPKLNLPKVETPQIDIPKIDTKAFEDNPLVPSREVMEDGLLSLLDALIKSGQIELAKSAFKTQLDVIKKIRPEQYEKYKKMGVESLAADAVIKQAEAAAHAPRSGNRFIDMLSDNGIPIGSSIKGVEDALRTQKQLDNSDPSEQIAKAVFEKFQTQILPGIVANLVAGRNPFKVPPRGQQNRRPMMPMSEVASHRLEQKMPPQMTQSISTQDIPYQGQSYDTLSAHRELRRAPMSRYETNSLYSRLSSSPRLAGLLRDERIQSIVASHSRRLRDDPIEDDTQSANGLGTKSNLLLGLFDNEEEEDEGTRSLEIRRSPSSDSSSSPLYTIRSSMMAALAQKPEIRRVLSKIRVRTDRVDELLRPQAMPFPDNKNAGFIAPRPVPKRPRKMLPLIIGANREEFVRRSPQKGEQVPMRSRVIDNMMNNPNIAPLFMDGTLMSKLVGRSMLSDQDKGRTSRRVLVTHPRFASSKGGAKEDERVIQTVEERAVPSLFEMPKGRHTRLRWTGARESEVPGVGGRFIIPSLDPTRPAINTAYSTQGRFRDEWDTTWKVPNAWQPGDEVRFSMKQKSQRFIGGDGNADMPAAGF